MLIYTFFFTSLASAQDDDDDSTPLDTSKPLWQLWIQEEVHREQTHLLPWRPDARKGETEDDCEDPERMVLFDDISSILFKVMNVEEMCLQCDPFIFTKTNYYYTVRYGCFLILMIIIRPLKGY